MIENKTTELKREYVVDNIKYAVVAFANTEKGGCVSSQPPSTGTNINLFL